MRTFLIETLKLLEKEVPPPPGCHHAIHYAKYGSDESGWADKLALHVNRGGIFHCLFIDNDDLYKSPAEFVRDIMQVLVKGE